MRVRGCWAWGWLLLFATACTEAPNPAPTTPEAQGAWKDGICAGCNVVLLTIDALRPDHLGMYGYGRPTSPNLDRFFHAGARFEDATSAATCTVNSVKQILTGDFDQKSERLAEYLKGAGYETSAVVSQHIFQWWNKESEFRAGFDHWDIQDPKNIDHHRMTKRVAKEVSDRALVWLAGPRDRSKPFFLWLHYFDPHDPYEPPKEYRQWKAQGANYSHGDRRRILRRLDRKGKPWHEAGAIFTEPDREHFVGLYDGEIQYTDAQVGRVFDALSKLPGDTLVVFTSDHGEMLGEGDLWDHCYALREHELRVPLAFNTPDGALHVGNLERAVSTLDVAPTVLGLLGIHPSVPEGELEGSDLRTPRKGPTLALFKNRVALREGGWKLYLAKENGTMKPEGLYHIAEDVMETQDLFKKERQRAARMLGAARSFVTGATQRFAVDSDVLEQLRAMGYTE